MVTHGAFAPGQNSAYGLLAKKDKSGFSPLFSFFIWPSCFRRRRSARAAGAAAVWGPRPPNHAGGRLRRPPAKRGPRARRLPAARALRLLLPLLFPSEIQIRFDEEDRPQVEPAYPHSQLYHVVCHHAVLQ